jgi:hypothetical protein
LLVCRIAVLICNQRKINNTVNINDRHFPSSFFFLPFFFLFTQCASLGHTANTSSTPPPQTSAQPEGPTLLPEEQLELFNRTLDRA